MSEIQKLQEMIDESKRIVFFGGAGVSTASGIPDFRDVDGLYNQHYRYPPEYMLSLKCFDTMPKEFFKFYNKKILTCLTAKPNYTHQFLAKLEEKGKLLSIITQNIDNLHQKAGSKKVRELHGSVMRNYCSKCNRFYDVEYTANKYPPYCHCGGIIKPGIILYGEPLDYETSITAINDLVDADMLIIGGTSLTVYPAASFLDYFRGRYLVIINKQQTDKDNIADLCFHDDINEVFKRIKI